VVSWPGALGSCSAELNAGSGPGDVACEVNKEDPDNPYVVAKFLCPAGSTVLQGSCNGGAPTESLFVDSVDIDLVTCAWRAPASATFSVVTVAALCTDLGIFGPAAALRGGGGGGGKGVGAPERAMRLALQALPDRDAIAKAGLARIAAKQG